MLTLPFEELGAKNADIAGGKGASLGEMTQAGIPVPPGFVILSETFERFIKETHLGPAIQAALDEVDHREIHTVDKASEIIQAMIHGAKMPEDIEIEITKNFVGLNCQFVAVRSSATSEDSADAAWAGQLDTYLNTTADKLLENVQRCWASLFTPRAIFYRFENKLHKTKISVAVVVQKMVESEVSGIAFSVHPVTQDRNQMIIEGGFGLGEAIVSGAITPDSYVLEKQPLRIIDKNIVEQKRMMNRGATGGSEWRDMETEHGERQALSDDQLLELADIILRIEKHYGFPCDIEWAFEGGKFFIVQSRPITTLAKAAAPIEKGPASRATLLNNGDSWLLAEDIPDIDFHFCEIWLSSFVNDLEKTIGINYNKVLCVFNGYDLKFYYGEKDSAAVGKRILDLTLQDPGFGEKINGEIRRLSGEFKEYSKKITPEYVGGLSGPDLASLLGHLDQLHTEIYTWGWLPNAVDMFHADFTNHLKGLVEAKLHEDRVNPALMALSTSPEKSVVQQEHESLLNLVILKKDNSPQFSEALKAHCAKYFYFKHLWIGKEGVYDEGHYEKEVDAFMASGEDARELLGKEEKIFKDVIAEREGLIKELDLDKDQVRIFDIYADFAVTKLIRRDAQLYWAYKMDFIFAELAKRFGITFMQAHFILPYEIEESLRSGFSPELKEVVARRAEHCVYYGEKGLEIVAVGDECDAFEGTIKEEAVLDISEFKGQVACVGKVTGTVKIVNEVADIAKVNEGDVLVSIATNPDVLPAMKKAIAFVTEQGGITSHAAIVAREMNKPCVIGTKIATKVLKDGDLVEVDANKGIVRILNKK
jgi:phosphoenolpyruvate synthase/pyruvate phosphate dikinase